MSGLGTINSLLDSAILNPNAASHETAEKATLTSVLGTSNCSADVIALFELPYKEIIDLKKLNSAYLANLNKTQEENYALTNKVNRLEQRISRLEQDKLINDIEIVGIPNATNENALDLSKKLFSMVST